MTEEKNSPLFSKQKRSQAIRMGLQSLKENAEWLLPANAMPATIKQLVYGRQFVECYVWGSIL